MIYDAFHRPLDTVDGTILQLMEGQGALYAMIKTDSGVRPGRLCRV